MACELKGRYSQFVNRKFRVSELRGSVVRGTSGVFEHPSNSVQHKVDSSTTLGRRECYTSQKTPQNKAAKECLKNYQFRLFFDSSRTRIRSTCGSHVVRSPWLREVSGLAEIQSGRALQVGPTCALHWRSNRVKLEVKVDKSEGLFTEVLFWRLFSEIYHKCQTNIDLESSQSRTQVLSAHVPFTHLTTILRAP